MRRYAYLFILLSLVYHSNLRPIASGDSLGASLIPFSFLLDGSVTLDRFGLHLDQNVWYSPAIVHRSGGHWYSVYPIAGPLLVSPFYLPIIFVPGISGQPPGTLIVVARVAEKFVAVALASASAVLLLVLLRRLIAERAAWMLTLVFALGMANWSIASQALWQHTFGQLAIAGCLYAVTRWNGAPRSPRWFWAAGLMAACAVAIRPTNVVLLPALGLALWSLRARALQCATVLVPAVTGAALAAAYNLAVFGRPSGGYPGMLEGNFWHGLAGILFSPGRGLLLYTPVVVFAFAALAPRARELRDRHRPVIIAASVFTVAQILLIAKWQVWGGGYCWGPRLLTEICVPVIVLIAVGLPAIRWRAAFMVLAFYGCIIQAVGVYCYPKGHWDHLPVSINDAPERLWNWADNPVNRTVRAGIAWEPYSIAAAVLTGGWPAAGRRLRELGINAY